MMPNRSLRPIDWLRISFRSAILSAATLNAGFGLTPLLSAEPAGLRVVWDKNYLTISGDAIKDREIVINYLEAYCRPGSTDREWGETVIGHRTEQLPGDSNAGTIRLRDTLRDGVIVEHVITAGVDRNDVNPRPLSPLVPSSGLCGCFSADEKQIMAVAWQPYQEIFQGVITCIHSDFRVGGLAPGERKEISGKIYVVPADVLALVARYQRDFGAAE